ncbi:MAG TPA: Fic family protein [Solirubrobacterales bacterium]|nr:Fic family protein [Solirubrobacterales bacterium]
MAERNLQIPPALRFGANYRHNPEMSQLLVRIAAALGKIQAAPVLPAVADELRASARVGTVHYSNLIEGNELPVVAAERAARGQLEADSRAKIELVNYVEALELIDAKLDAGELELTADFLCELHRTTTRGLGREDYPQFKPHHEGEWRDGDAIVFNYLTRKVMHEGPPAEEVPPRMASMFEWLERKLGSESPFLLAGVMHYGITDIHPFADGNGRVARLFQVALLMKEGVLPGRMFSFERFYAENPDAYYAALGSVREQTFNMGAWLHYFLEGLAEEYERVATTVQDLASMTLVGGTAPLRLSPSQERALTSLRIQGRREFTRRDYEEASGLGRAAAGNDLRRLVGHGILVPRGSGTATRYAFPAPEKHVTREGDGRGRPRQWSAARIERELREFLDGRSTWPSPEEFRAAKKGALYAAASRNGGIGRWRRAAGL